MSPAEEESRPAETTERRLGLIPVARAGAVLIGGWQIAVIVAVALVALLFFVGLVVSATTSATIGGQEVCSFTGAGSHDGIPSGYLPWLERAATRYHLGSRGFGVIAAIHKVESDFGRSNLPGVHSGTNSAGAAGPGQFLAGTWAAYGVDADGDGRRDVYSIPDSVFATANYLHASGAPGDWRAAVFAYNHADWYVNEVLDQAERYQGRLSCRLIGAPGPGNGTVALGRINWNDTSGAWGGSEKFAELAVRLARRHGCSVVSSKRPTESTASGNISDHWIGARHSYAVDLDACSLTYPGGAADLTARDVAAAFGLPGHTGVVDAIRGRYRVQLLWQTDVGGDHFNHVHVGIRNVCCLAGG
jgi:transglycosylase-like protein with SLT domain